MRVRAHVFAGGGGSEEEEARVLSRFVSHVGRGGRVLHIPWAQSGADALGAHAWATSALRAHGVADVAALALGPVTPEVLDGVDGVFLSGGNTFLLLHRLRETGLDRLLADRVGSGLPCYGGSAGAIVLGAHIETASHADPNSVGLRDLRGLDLFEGVALWCHTAEGDAERIDALVRRTGVGVVALPEDGGLTLGSAGLEAIGPGEVRVWDGASGPRVLPPAG